MVDPNWQHGHFGTQPLPPKPRDVIAGPRRRISVGAIIFLSVLVVGLAGVTTTEFLGVTQLGLIDWFDEKPINQQGFAQPAPSPPSRPEAAPEKILPAAPVIEAPVQQAAAKPSGPSREVLAKLGQQDRGIEMMQREISEVEAAENGPSWQLSLRDKKHRRPPLSAVERLAAIEEYVAAHPRMSPVERNQIKGYYDAATADRNNATKRLAELGEKKKSLLGRIGKAEATKASLLASP